MNKNLHFLSGIPRSGSTVLAAILNQHPSIHVSTTSGLVHALDGVANTWAQAALLNANDPAREQLARVMRGMVDAFYEDVEKPTVLDKSRGWPIAQIMHAMGMVLKHPPKIIATVRSVPDCAASFVRIAKPDDLDAFVQSGQLLDHLKAAYISLQDGYCFMPECFLMVEYDDLIANPKVQLDRVHEFLKLPSFKYDLEAIDGKSVEEDDENQHGYAGMHAIKPKLERQHTDDPKDVLNHHYVSFCQQEFWLDKPRTIPPIHDLDLQLAAATVGDFAEGWRIAQKLEIEEPNNHKAAFNRAHYVLRMGKIQEGYRLLNRGRFFNEKFYRPDAPTEEWDGIRKGTALLALGGGLGDQIHQVRYAKNIATKGCKVIVACAGPLASLFTDVEGVSAVIQREAAFGVYHDFWVDGMSAPVPLGLELEDLSGKPYIRKPAAIKGRKKRIGLRWQGNSRFENDHHKLFPHDVFFDAVKDADADFISLQRDEGTEHRPPWVREVPLRTWEDTRNAIASCDLVISSCTSVSHLSAAMGVETWVVIPIMPYYLYAIDGPTTPYYDSMRLFRQPEFGHWTEVFNQVKIALGGSHVARNTTTHSRQPPQVGCRLFSMA
jgi:hypothetical protein